MFIGESAAAGGKGARASKLDLPSAYIPEHTLNDPISRTHNVVLRTNGLFRQRNEINIQQAHHNYGCGSFRASFQLIIEGEKEPLFFFPFSGGKANCVKRGGIVFFFPPLT